MTEPTDGAPAEANQPTGQAGDPFTGPEWIGRYELGAAGRSRRVSARRRTRRRMQRRTGWILIGLGGLMIVTIGWVVVTGLMARSELTAMKSDLTQMRSDVNNGNVDDARIVATNLAQHAKKAHSLTSGPAWWAGALLPGVGDPLDSARGIAAAADNLGAQTVPKLISVSSSVDPAQFKLTDHQIDITPLINSTPQLDAAVASADAQLKNIKALPSHTWFGSINTSVDQVDSELTKLTGSLHNIDQAAHAAPTLLGYSSPQRYFVGFQNEAEARGSGGIPGAFGILVADQGKVTFTHFGNDTELDGVDSGLDFGADYDNAWAGFDPTSTYLNSTVDPNFKYAAQIWAAMWQKKSGEHVDGAISLDPTALSYLLGVTGAARLPDGSQVSASNVVPLTQSTVYSMFTNEAARKAYLLQIAQAVDQKLLAGTENPRGLYRAAGKAAGERRLLIWESNKTIESFLASGPIGGSISEAKPDIVAPAIIDYSANKLTYYMKTEVDWSSQGCGNSRDVTLTVRLTNGAPSGLPSYVAQRTDDPASTVKSGDNRVMLYYVGAAGGSLDGITVDGVAGTVLPGTDGAHPTYSALVEVPRGATRSVVLHLVEPGGSSPTVVHQPAVSPMVVHVRPSKC